jgi:phage-related protein
MSDSTFQFSKLRTDKPVIWIEGEIKTPPFSLAARIEAGMLLRRLQRGENIGLPHSRPMPVIGAHCHELRVRDENRNWRIFYHLSSDAVVILDVQNKTTQKTQQTVLETCARRLEAAGFKVGSADEFLNLTPEESALVSLRLSLADQVRRRREHLHVSQSELARRIGSSQSRIAKLEAAESDVSLDLIFRALFATGAKIRDVCKALSAA